MDPTRYTPFFSWRARVGRARIGRAGFRRVPESGARALWCEDVRLDRIAGRVGTPAYVYSRASLEDAYRRLDRAFRPLPHALCYSVKANSNLSILRLLARLGSSFDIVSGGELYRLRRVGVPGRRIVFSGVGKTAEEIREALRERILLLNVESEAELELVAAEASRLGRPAPAAIRLNPDVAAGAHPHIATGLRRHKFGVDWEAAWRMYLAYKGSRWVHWQGISAHIGSQILSVAPFGRAVRSVAHFARRLAREGFALKYFDFGGGLGIRYANERPIRLREYARAVAGAVRPLGCYLLLEPGRVLAGPAGVILMRVLYTKRSGGRNFVVVDAAMNDFLRPALYGAIHPITRAEPLPPLTPTLQSRSLGTRGGPPSATGKMRAAIVGPVCETGDCFLEDWPIEEVKAGDLLVLWGTGAYGFVSTTNYNSRPRPPEVLVEGRRFRVIRRRESRADLIRGE